MSGKADSTVSISPSAMRRLSSSMSIRPCISSSALLHVNVNRLPFRIVIQRRQPQLAAQATLFHAAERRLHVYAAPGIDGEVAGLHGAGNAEGPADVARPDRAGEAVARVVRQGHRLRLVAER